MLQRCHGAAWQHRAGKRSKSHSGWIYMLPIRTTPNHNCVNAIFWHFTYEDLLDFVRYFLCGKLSKPCHCIRIAKRSVSKIVASIINKHHNILIKRLSVATAVPSGIQRHHRGIGVSGYTIGTSIQAWAIPPPSWNSAHPVTTGRQ